MLGFGVPSTGVTVPCQGVWGLRDGLRGCLSSYFSFYKHLYEHHPHWQFVAKEFNFSKHQQVSVCVCEIGRVVRDVASPNAMHATVAPRCLMCRSC